MPNNYINLATANNRVTQGLRRVVDDFTGAQHRLATLKADFDQMVNGADYTPLEAALGLTAGQGVIVYNLVSGASAELAADVNF